jgi:hypothetical protein
MVVVADDRPDYAAGPVHPLHTVDDGICVGGFDSHARGEYRDRESGKLE